MSESTAMEEPTQLSANAPCCCWQWGRRPSGYQRMSRRRLRLERRTHPGGPHRHLPAQGPVPVPGRGRREQERVPLARVPAVLVLAMGAEE